MVKASPVDSFDGDAFFFHAGAIGRDVSTVEIFDSACAAASCLTARRGQNARRSGLFAWVRRTMSQISTSMSRFATCHLLMPGAIVAEIHGMRKFMTGRFCV
jgi:hypothetical protein